MAFDGITRSFQADAQITQTPLPCTSHGFGLPSHASLRSGKHAASEACRPEIAIPPAFQPPYFSGFSGSLPLIAASLRQAESGLARAETMFTTLRDSASATSFMQTQP